MGAYQGVGASVRPGKTTTSTWALNRELVLTQDTNSITSDIADYILYSCVCMMHDPYQDATKQFV